MTVKNEEADAPITMGPGLPDAGLAASAAALPATAVLHRIMLAADTNFVLHDEPAVLDPARKIVRQRLGPGNGRNDAER